MAANVVSGRPFGRLVRWGMYIPGCKERVDSLWCSVYYLCIIVVYRAPHDMVTTAVSVLSSNEAIPVLLL